MKLQLMNQATRWETAREGTAEHYLNSTARENHLSVEQVVEKLSRGEKLRYGSEWYMQIRDADARAAKAPRVESGPQYNPEHDRFVDSSRDWFDE